MSQVMQSSFLIALVNLLLPMTLHAHSSESPTPGQATATLLLVHLCKQCATNYHASFLMLHLLQVHRTVGKAKLAFAPPMASHAFSKSLFRLFVMPMAACITGRQLHATLQKSDRLNQNLHDKQPTMRSLAYLTECSLFAKQQKRSNEAEQHTPPLLFSLLTSTSSNTSTTPLATPLVTN